MKGKKAISSMVLERIKIFHRVPTGPETKNDYAGDGQQKITAVRLVFSRTCLLSI